MKASEIYRKGLYRYSTEKTDSDKRIIVMREIDNVSGSCRLVLDRNGKVLEDMEVATSER